MTGPVLLVVAKAPVAGLAKTRVAAAVGDERAADLAAASLLDTLATVTAIGWPVVVALTGDLGRAARREEIQDALAPTRVVRQRGTGLGERLAHAHADAGTPAGVVQVGMDTPQLRPDDYLEAGRAVRAGARVLGPATDGGWWLLGLPVPAEASRLRRVRMSQPDTAEQTRRALGTVRELRVVTDMDTWPDAQAIAHEVPQSRLARAVSQIVVPT